MQAKASRALSLILLTVIGASLCGCGGGDESPAVAVATAPQVPAVDAYRERGEAASTTDPAADAMVGEGEVVADSGVADATAPVDSSGQPVGDEALAADEGMPPPYQGSMGRPANYLESGADSGEQPASDPAAAEGDDLPPAYQGSMGRPANYLESGADSQAQPASDVAAAEADDLPPPYQGSMGRPAEAGASETPQGYEDRGAVPPGYEGRGETAAADAGTSPAAPPQDALAAAKAGLGQLFNTLTGNAPPEPATLPDGSPNPAAADFHAQLAELLFDAQAPHHEQAVLALLEVKPKDVTDKKVRARIAQGYKHVAMETNAHQAEAVRGLVKWGGKFSAPLLIELLEKGTAGAEDAIYEGLGAFGTAEAAKVVVERMGTGANSEAALACLRKMGDIAEAPLIGALPFETPEANRAAIELLGDVGTRKSNAILRQATKSENEDVAAAANEAIRKIQERLRAAKASEQQPPP